ncbi:carbohydrate ABC transporter permease [Neobacillus vireti]|uniref:Binding-protein-dependent transport system inner membrane protein n=1 Tax=Neobacillus vireti LMG 21834 TaxID=1131730 RepID=A0AB94IK86_9BACI|nr:carbohydrate ABC transporter permease [Neobacillus vireti]ETI67521.1 binding-protein-dependent transport system inner membrane protein [Neobacillus vireti LMG 21834]KLT18517.1 sugar ABC transporter permease [Neobacillus vireti]
MKANNSIVETGLAGNNGKTKKTINVKKSLAKFAVYFFLILVAFTCLLPFYSMMVTSSHANSDIARKLLLVPGREFVENYKRLIDTVPIWRGFANTIFITVSSTVLSLYFSALAGYGFSKYNYKGKNILFMAVLGTMMIPGQLGIIGFFKLMDTFNMLNTYWPIILPSISNAFGIFFMKQMCDSSIPTEILESGRIDGCGELKIFHRLVLPLLMPSLATLGIFSFIGKWNDFLTPMIILFDNELQPLPVMIAMVKSQFSTDFGAMYVGIVISVIPILIFFSIVSKKIISGVTAGALKG